MSVYRLPLPVRTLLRQHLDSTDPVLQAALRAVDAGTVRSGDVEAELSEPQRVALISAVLRSDAPLPTLQGAQAVTLVRLGQ